MAKKQDDAVLAVKKGAEIRKIYDPADRERDLIAMVYNRFRSMKDSPDRQREEKKWDYHEKLWEAWREAPGPDQWESNHVVPLVFSATETALSEMILQNIRPLILPRGSEDVPRARVMSHIYDFAWEMSNSDMMVYDVMQEGLMHGTSIEQELFWQDKRIIQKRTDSKDLWKLEETEVTDYDDVYGEIVKLQDFHVDENARSMRGTYGARDCIRRYIMDIEDARIMFSGDIWNPLGNMRFVKPGGDTNYYEFFQPPNDMMGKNKVEVLWYWSIRPKDWLIITINDVLVKFGPNPFSHKQLPFNRSVDTKRTHQFYGKGISEVLESMQDEATTIRRMTIDRSHLDLDKMFGVSRQMGLNEEDLAARPHGLIPMDDPNGLKPIEYGDTPRSTEMVLKHVEDDSVIATGINPRSQALPTAGTATEAAILKESTLRRINKKLWIMKKMFFVEQAKMRVSNIIQFYKQPKLEKIVGEVGTEEYQKEVAQLRERGIEVETVGGAAYRKKYREIALEGKALEFGPKGELKEHGAKGMTFFEANPKHFVPINQQGFNIKFSAGPNIEISKPLERTQGLELYDRIMQVALTVPGSYDPVKIGDMAIKLYEKNPDDLKPDAPPEDENAKRLEMQMQLAGMENTMLMKGQQVPATPNVSPVHTRVHLEFMNSPQFQDGVDPKSPIVQFFTEHVMGELIAQQARGTQVAAQPGFDQSAAPTGNPGGPATSATSVSQGISNRPGGMAQPSTPMNSVLPNKNNGANPAMRAV